MNLLSTKERNKEMNPLQNVPIETLIYIQNNSEVGSQLRADATSMLVVHQQSLQFSLKQSQSLLSTKNRKDTEG